MVDIVSIFHGVSSCLLYDIHHIARLVLCPIREVHRIVTQDEEASTSDEHPSDLLRHLL